MATNKLYLQRFCRVVFATLALALFGSNTLLAQNSTGTVRGTIESAGAPVGSAQILARNTNSGVQRVAQSNDAGFYTLAGLVPGTYEITVRRIGSAPQTRTVVVQIGTTQVQDFSLAQQAAQLESQIITATTGIETKSSEVSTNVTQAQISKLPSSTRNFLDLAALSPGVIVTEDRTNSTTFKTVSADGQSPSSVNLFIDGTSFKNDLTPAESPARTRVAATRSRATQFRNTGSSPRTSRRNTRRPRAPSSRRRQNPAAMSGAEMRSSDTRTRA